MLYPTPIKLADANAFVALHHRHHDPVKFHIFSVGVCGWPIRELCGVAIVMRPVAPADNDMPIAEISRLATDGTKNAASFLMARAANAAFNIGYMKVQTFTLPEEGGASLRAAGFEFAGTTEGSPWNSRTRKRKDTHPVGRKWKWERYAPLIERKRKGDRIQRNFIGAVRIAQQRPIASVSTRPEGQRCANCALNDPDACQKQEPKNE